MISASEQPGQGPSLVYNPPRAVSNRADSAEEAVAWTLEPSEHVQLFAECLRRQRLHIFERCTIAVTDRRILVVSPAFPWGWEVKHGHPLATSSVLNGKERIDGSRLLVIQLERGTLCLYFARSHRDEADAVLALVGLGSGPRVLPPGPEPMHAQPVDVDRVALAQMLTDLSHSPEDEDEEDVY